LHSLLVHHQNPHHGHHRKQLQELEALQMRTAELQRQLAESRTALQDSQRVSSALQTELVRALISIRSTKRKRKYRRESDGTHGRTSLEMKQRARKRSISGWICRCGMLGCERSGPTSWSAM
jgi:hypothetical protein